MPTSPDNAHERRSALEHPPLKPLLLDLLDFTQATQHTLVTELSDTERVAIGTLVHWSARDHMAPHSARSVGSTPFRYDIRPQTHVLEAAPLRRSRCSGALGDTAEQR